MLSPFILFIYDFYIYDRNWNTKNNKEPEEIELKLISMREISNYNSC